MTIIRNKDCLFCGADIAQHALRTVTDTPVTAATTVMNLPATHLSPKEDARYWETDMRWKPGVVLGMVMLLPACEKAPPPQPIRDVMVKRVQPTALIYWNSVKFVHDETGPHDIKPRNDAEWERTRKAAADLVGFGELLLTPAYTEGRDEDWKQFAQGLVDIGKQAEQAAQHKNPDEVFDIGATIYEVCSACHQVYLPENRKKVTTAPVSQEAK